MYMGIIAEGKSDLAVIKNILKGKLGIDSSQLQYLQPDMAYDETDLHNRSAKKFSNWALVRQSCIERKKFSDFFSVDEIRFIIIQIDTAEAGYKNYEVERPAKNGKYSGELRNRVIKKINEWTENQFTDQFFYAIAIEETEAWVLTIYSDRPNDTCSYTDPKAELNRVLNKKLSAKQKQIFKKNEFDKFDKISENFRKSKKLNSYMLLNESLKLFCESLEILSDCRLG